MDLPEPFRLFRDRREYALHLAAWSLYLVLIWSLYLVLILYMAAYHDVPVLLSHPGVHLLGQVAIFYLNYQYFIPKLLGQSRAGGFLLINLGCVLLLEGMTLSGFYLIRSGYPAGNRPPLSLPVREQAILRFFELLFFILLACVARFTGDWFVLRQRANEAENSRLKAELAMLRAQIHPHFLFNSLNSIYALSLKQSPDTPLSILHLSQLMRYVLYESGESKMPLSREMEIIGRYLELQTIRLPDSFVLLFDVKGQPESLHVEPLLLLPLVENIFKHGDTPASIKVDVSGLTLRLETSNRIRSGTPAEPGGTGLSNLRRRLDFLYPARYELKTEEKEGRFLARLTLNTAPV